MRRGLWTATSPYASSGKVYYMFNRNRHKFKQIHKYSHGELVLGTSRYLELRRQRQKFVKWFNDLGPLIKEFSDDRQIGFVIYPFKDHIIFKHGREDLKKSPKKVTKNYTDFVNKVTLNGGKLLISLSIFSKVRKDDLIWETVEFIRPSYLGFQLKLKSWNFLTFENIKLFIYTSFLIVSIRAYSWLVGTYILSRKSKSHIVSILLTLAAILIWYVFKSQYYSELIPTMRQELTDLNVPNSDFYDHVVHHSLNTRRYYELVRAFWERWWFYYSV